MSLEFVNPFIESTITTLSTVAAMTPKRCMPQVKAEKETSITGDVSAVIGLTGKANGWVAISFPKGLVFKIVSKMLSEEKSSLDEDVRDAVGEIINMIAGGAKADLAQMGLRFKIAIPTIIIGESHIINQKSDAPCIVVPFELAGETFSLEICLKKQD